METNHLMIVFKIFFFFAINITAIKCSDVVLGGAPIFLIHVSLCCGQNYGKNIVISATATTNLTQDNSFTVYLASLHSQATISPPVKRHSNLNGVPLTGRWWPTFICLLGLYHNIKITQEIKKMQSFFTVAV